MVYVNQNNRDLLTLKVFGCSNLKIFIILAFTSFLLSWIVLFFVNPTSYCLNNMKRLNLTILDHLVTFVKWLMD